MPCSRLLLMLLCMLSLGGASFAAAADPEAPPAGKVDQTVEQIAESAKKSVVVISVTGRDGKPQGLGTGFIISEDGLIATNLHVIGEARPISVQFADGTKHPVTAIHATQRASDLALIRIDGKKLPVLELGDSDSLKQGQPVVALGNPHGLKHSIVSGVVSGTREIDGRPMIQLAIPIEPGNSGGPLLDLQGRVHGVITMKSLVTPNLGFAVAVNLLKPLLEKPTPIPIERWLTIGALDPKEWTPLFGARWRQRSGRILVDGQGQGFGGRSLCLSESPPPELPYEMAVKVRLDDEKGAAGLVFLADGGDKHYGFYPSAGKLRLSRFDGPDVFSWQVLFEKASPAYRPGEWNRLKVRLEKDKITCFVNEQLVFEASGAAVSKGKVGIAKFRETQAEFKSFQVAPEIASDTLTPDAVARVEKLIADLPPKGNLPQKLVEDLQPDASVSLTVLRERAKLLEQQAGQLKQLALIVHQKRVQSELAQLLQQKDAEIDLLRAALLVSLLDNDELEVEAYVRQVARMAREITAGLPQEADDAAKLAALRKLLFDEYGFHGSRGDYYNRSNSYLNEVLDDREGLPITLSVVYMELARQIGVNVVGIGMPGQFIVAHLPETGDPAYIDVYEGATPLTRADLEQRVRASSGQPLQEEQLTPMKKPAIITRMLRNLLGNAQNAEDVAGMLRYVEAIVAIAPESPQERWLRAVLRFQSGQTAGAALDVAWLLEHEPEGIPLERVRELHRALDRME